MKTRNTRKVLSALLALLMALALIPAAGFVTASAAGPNPNIVISQTDTVGEIQAAIMSSIAAYDVVTVTGSKTDVGDDMLLTIPAGKKVIWKAPYTGSTNYMVTLRGAGTFEVAAGGTISTTGSGHAIGNAATTDTVSITVSGGTVSISGNGGTAIDGWNGNVTVTGGTVQTTGNNSVAIDTYAGNVSVSGGTVSATAGKAIAGNGAGAININGPVTISGGNGAFNKQPVIGLSPYKATWSNNADGSASSTGNTYTWNASHKYVKIEAFAPTFAVSVVKGTANKTAAAAGETVTITADAAPKNQRFSSWTASAGVTLADAKSATTTFTMPANNVSVTANFVKTIFSTKYEAKFWNWVLFFLCFGFIWMWF